jgi:hypothetical protein
LTLLRITAPGAVARAIVTAPSTSGASAAIAVVAAVAAATFVVSAHVAQATGNALAYGDEIRFPLHIPTPLLCSLVPLAIALTLTGAVAGPLLLADGRVISGAIVTVVGVPAAALAVRSLPTLSTRWIVLVPAGVAIVDALTLADPVLIRREQIASLSRGSRQRVPADTVDLTLGTTNTPTLLETREPVSLTRRQSRSSAAIVDVTTMLLAPTLRGELLAAAGSRRIPV